MVDAASRACAMGCAARGEREESTPHTVFVGPVPVIERPPPLVWFLVCEMGKPTRYRHCDELGGCPGWPVFSLPGWFGWLRR